MRHILIVDDQPCVRELIAAELTLSGFRVSTANDAESARQSLYALTPDLVVLDLYLDGPEGFELLNDIKSEFPSLPVLILTAYDSFRDDPRLACADGYIVKGLDFQKIKRQVMRLVNREEPGRSMPRKRAYAF